MRSGTPRSLLLFALLGGVVAFIVAALGSTELAHRRRARRAWVIGTGDARLAHPPAAPATDPSDPGRRRFLTLAGLGSFAWLLVGGALGRADTLGSPSPIRCPIQDAMANDLGAEYMELVRRAYHPGRSGELQLVLAPYNSANYAHGVARPGAGSTAPPATPSVWMYLERVPLVVHAPGRVEPSDSTRRASRSPTSPRPRRR